MSYRLFGPKNNEVLGTYPSFESVQQQAQSHNRGKVVRFKGPADTGPQGHAKHWYGETDDRDVWYMIVEWPDQKFKLIDFEDFNGCGKIYPHERGYDTLEENEILYYCGDYPVYSAYKKVLTVEGL